MVASFSLYCTHCGAVNQGQAAFCFACGQPLQGTAEETIATSPTGSLTSNHLLNQRYQIISRLGTGGFGAVYKAEDTQLGGRVVAVKEMSQSNLKPQEITDAVAAFKREALMLAGLTHQNLPRIYDHFSDGGRWYLAMDFIEGQTLEERLTTAGVSLAETFDIGIQLCTVLDYLHTRQPPIIFRDLKPANVILAPDGHLYLIDFGIARHFKPGQSKDTIAFGSPGYAAPEQYGKAQTTPRADIYSLGATLHQMLTGNDPTQAPFRFISPRSHNPAVPVALDVLVTRMLDMDESKRPASVADVKQELQRIVAQVNSGQIDIVQTVPAGQFVTSSASIGTTFLTYREHVDQVKAVVWSPDGTRIASSDNSKVQMWVAGTGKTLLTYHGHSNSINAVAWSPDDTRIASASDDKTVQVWLVAQVGNIMSGAYVFDYRGHSNWVSALGWSPDGTRIASASADTTVQVWWVATGKTLLTYRGHSSRVWAVAWSPDGRRMASASSDSTVQVWDTTDGHKIMTYRGHADTVNAVAWSPNGAHIVSGSADQTVQVWDVVQGSSAAAVSPKVRTYRGHHSWVWAVAWSPDGKYIASAGGDGTVRLLNVVTGEEVFVYRGHRESVFSLAWSPDGSHIASAGRDQTVQVWQAQ